MFPAEPSELLQTCLQQAARAASTVLQASVSQVVAELQAAEAATTRRAERDLFGQAWRQLQTCSAPWAQALPERLQHLFDHPDPERGYTGFASTQPGLLDFQHSLPAQLALVDDHHVSHHIDFSRLLQALVTPVDDLLSELDGLVSAAQGLPAVDPARNPLRPEVFAQALRTLVLETDAETEARARWLRQLGTPFGLGLRTVYERTLERLSAAGLRAAGYRARGLGAAAAPAGAGRRDLAGRGAVARAGGAGRGANPRPPAAGSVATPGQAAPPVVADADWPDGGLTGSAGVPLLREFLRAPPADADWGLPRAYYAEVEAEARHWERQAPGVATPPADHRGLEAVARPPREVRSDGELDATRWGRWADARTRGLARAGHKREATAVGQALGVAVVQGLVDQVAQDPRLLAPVREAIVALEPALARLALADPRFFEDEGHPGRRLMERVAQRSLRYNDEYGSAFQSFLAPVAEVVQSLNADGQLQDARPFDTALRALEAHWSAEDSAEAARRERVLATMQFAEERQALADRLAQEISERSDLDQVPAVVLDFLYGPWALVMAHARLTDTTRAIDPGGCGVLISELLWSVKREFTLRQPAELMALIPGLLQRLNQGLDLIGHHGPEREAFLEALMRLHLPVLRLRRLRSERDARQLLAETEAEARPATPQQRVARPAAQPWMAPHERADAGYEEAPASGAGPGVPAVPPGETPTEPVEAGRTSGEAATPEATLAGLRPGQWVDLRVQQDWLRAQLVWAGRHGTLFMFVSHGGRPHSMTRRTCLRLLRDQGLRPVAGDAVVGRALQVLQAA